MIDRTRSSSGELRQDLGELSDEARALAGTLNRVCEEACSAVGEQVQTRPYTMLGLAAGTGFILGGGLPSIISRTLIRAATRAAISLAVGQVVSAMTGQGQQEYAGGET